MNKSDLLFWARSNTNVYWIDDSPWIIRNSMLLPMSMPHTVQKINRNSVKEQLKKSTALLAHWSTEWNSMESEWWWTCCDLQNYDLEVIENVNARRAIRKGLTYCEVKRINPQDFVELAYPIFFKSLVSYRIPLSRIPSKEEYKKTIFQNAQYSGFELWGVFIEERLVGFSTCIYLDNAVNLGSTKSDPDYHKFNSNNALFYHITKYYINECKVKYITNGYRNLLHQTNINNFLIKMGYRKIYCRLNVELSFKLSAFVKSGLAKNLVQVRGIEKVIPEQFAQINALNKLIQISQSF
ncbi:MAG: hypothetical protein KGZ85_04910 [Ignavibacterium sp.]|nr:hypothetical protein [Ignavibacterium sp.]